MTSLFIVAPGSPRFSLVIWCATALCYLIKINYITFMGTDFVNFLTFLPNLLVILSGAILAAHANSSSFAKLIIPPSQLIKLYFVEFSQLLILDRIFLFWFIFSLFLAAINFKNESTWLLILVFLALVSTAGINGVPGVNFRYHLQVLPFIIAYLANYHGDFRTLRK